MIKGYEGLVIDEDDVYDLIYSAFLNKDFDPSRTGRSR
jgi:hypothetical protein